MMITGHSNTTRSAGPGLSTPAPRTLVVEGFRTRVPIPGELPPSPERPASGSLRPSAVSARTRSSGSPTLASPPVRRQPLCNPTTLNTHPPTAWETSANSTPARRCCPCCAWCACCIAHVLLLVGSARACYVSRLSQWSMAAMRVVVRYRTASLSYLVARPRLCLRRPRPRSTALRSS